MPFTPDPSGPPADLELGDTYGAMLLSTIIVAVFYGITVLQSLYYYENFPKDPWILKVTVAGVWVLDTLTLFLNAHAIYFYLITNYANPAALQTQVWSVQVELLVAYTIVLIVQMFFIFRIYQLRSQFRFIPALLGLFAFAAFCIVIASFIIVIHDDNWDSINRPEVTWPLTVNWALGNIVDVSITVVLCWYLWSEKLGVRENTNMMLNRIIVFLVNRGAIAAVIQILTLSTKFIWPQTLVWIAFHNALSKVYANSMLASLNSRVALRSMVMDSKLGSTLPSMGFPHASGRPLSNVPTEAMGRQYQITTLQLSRTPAIDITEHDHHPPTKLNMSMSAHSGHCDAAVSPSVRSQPSKDDVEQFDGTLSQTQTERQRSTDGTHGKDGKDDHNDAYSYTRM